MGQMTPYTGLELEAARRREVIRGELDEVVRVRAEAHRERRTGKRDLAWIAASATIALGSRLARG